MKTIYSRAITAQRARFAKGRYDASGEADVRALIEKHLPEVCREKETWRYVAAQLTDAARGGDAVDVATSLRMLLSLEGVACVPQ